MYTYIHTHTHTHTHTHIHAYSNVCKYITGVRPARPALSAPLSKRRNRHLPLPPSLSPWGDFFFYAVSQCKWFMLFFRNLHTYIKHYIALTKLTNKKHMWSTRFPVFRVRFSFFSLFFYTDADRPAEGTSRQRSTDCDSRLPPESARFRQIWRSTLFFFRHSSSPRLSLSHMRTHN